MIKIWFLTIGMLILVQVAKSQSKFGIKAGVNFASQEKSFSIPQVPSVEKDGKVLVGYQFGGFYKIMLQQRLMLSAEIDFSVIGSRMVLLSPGGTSYNSREKLGYIELPFIIQYQIGRIYFGAGPGVGFKVFSKIKDFEDMDFNISYYQTIDVAANILAGYNLSKTLDLNARYSYGLTNLFENGGYAEVRNRFFNLSFLYALK
jgi:hypothetical protein